MGARLFSGVSASSLEPARKHDMMRGNVVKSFATFGEIGARFSRFGILKEKKVKEEEIG